MSTSILEAQVSGFGEAEEVELTQWAALAGRWTFHGNRANYVGPSGTTTASQSSYGILRSAIDFRDGTVRLAVTLRKNENNELSSGGIALGFHSLSQPYSFVQIGGWERAYSVGRFTPGFGWEEIAGAGSRENLRPDEKHSLEIGVRGQRIRLNVNGVEVLDAVLRSPLSGSGLALFAWGAAAIDFADASACINQLRVFAVMPFHEPFDTLYRDVIYPVANELDIDVTRVDEIYGPGIILDEIHRQIEECHAIVADVSPSRPSEYNPNVFYELGYAHALKKPAILLARRESGKSLPFDIQGYRAIFYDDSIAGKKAVEAHLRKHLESIKRDS